MKGCMLLFIIFIMIAFAGFYGIYLLGWQPNGYGKDEHGEFIYQDSCITSKLDTIRRFTGKFWITRVEEVCDSSIEVKEYIKKYE